MKNSWQLAAGSGQSFTTRRAARRCLACALFVLLAMAALASGQQAGAPPARDVESNVIELYQSLLDLQTPWTVMCVAAHPDDEDGATLTILRRKYGVHTVTLFSTYGEGGQNAVGPELYEELGAIRARETEEAARIQGSEPYFLGLRDFGFSKAAEEAFRIWGHDEALRRMVLKIRELRPDVIITNHDTTSGHGHHQATGRLVLEAFDAAADPKRFPEQLRGAVGTWQAQRLFVRFQFEGSGSKAAEEEAVRTGTVLSINPNERDAVRGTTYAEQALAALQQHATQGPWPKTLPAGGRPPIRYRLARSVQNAPQLSANPQSPLDGMSLPVNFADKLVPGPVKLLLTSYEAGQHNSRAILQTLIAVRKSSAAHPGVNPGPRLHFDLMDERLNHALAAASGLSATLTPNNDVLIPGTATKFSLKISNKGEGSARIQSVNLRGLRQAVRLNFPRAIAPGETVTVELENSTPRTAPVTVPRAEHLYDGLLFGEELAAIVNISIDGASFPVEAKSRIDVAPAVEIASITPSPLVITPATPGLSNQPGKSGTTLYIGPGSPDASTTFTLRLINHQDKMFKGGVHVGARFPKIGVRVGDVPLAAKEVRELKVQRNGSFDLLNTASGQMRSIPNVITFSVAGDGSQVSLTRRMVRVIWSDARVAPNLRVGYIRSFDDTLRDSLAALGVEAKELSVDDARTGDLSKYQAIIIDNRGYQAHPELIAANSRLLDYTSAGGTLIVFYHKTNEWNPDPKQNRPQLAPYPITLGNSRVTDENAPLELAETEHPLLNFPNKITEADFAGWIQERGLYYPQTWDSHYSAPFATNDPGEQSLRGGLLATGYGRGRYIYTSMVWYRQLRAGIPGAYRMLANMISYGRETMNAK